MNGDYILETRGLGKHFTGFRAVNDVNLRVKRGSIHALIGPNGAGKTTVFNLLTRFLPVSEGSIHFEGDDVTALQAARVARMGLVRSFQVSAIFSGMTVLDNVKVGLQKRDGLAHCFWRGSQAIAHLDAEAMNLLEAVDLADVAHHKAAGLPYGKRRSLELATTLGMNPKVMLLDEPTQGMGIEDVAVVTRLIRRVAESRTVLIVEHNLNVVSALSDTVTVLARGSVLAEGSYSEVAADARVVQAYIGVSDDE
ncbi:ABC transporter ATP-binding protein [Variovorax sp. VNK109]|uniref:ABC transporter ATP-binding protein n=1 Tax=Variovorax sp. VNK109 TaxID=3400919 RepID=UPI003C0F84C4